MGRLSIKATKFTIGKQANGVDFSHDGWYTMGESATGVKTGGDGMKVLFLDIDGVLNTDRYVLRRDWCTQGNIDETHLPLLRRILEETGAVIVLSTSWRTYWDPDPARWAPEWQESGEIFARYGIEIYDRTPSYNGNNRDREVGDWLAAHEGEVESFAILDDRRMGWGELQDRLVFTYRSHGLTEKHTEKAIELLRTPLRS
jgi:hypothetical protein